jgi:hypothetical protein
MWVLGFFGSFAGAAIQTSLSLAEPQFTLCWEQEEEY